MTTKPKTTDQSLAEKITSTDSMTLTKAESDELRRNLRQILERQAWADFQLLAIRDAHIRNGVEVVHFEHDDGSVSYSLQPKPQPTTETVN